MFNNFIFSRFEKIYIFTKGNIYIILAKTIKTLVIRSGEKELFFKLSPIIASTLN